MQQIQYETVGCGSSQGAMTATPMCATYTPVTATSVSAPPPPAQPAPAGVAPKKPKAIRAHVRLQGYTSLPPGKAAQMKKAIQEIGEAVITLNELIHDPTQPADVMYPKVIALESVERSANTMIALATEDAARLPNGALKTQATQLHAELMGVSVKLSAAFQVYRDTRDVNAPLALNTLLLTVLEKGTELLGVVDKHTIECIGDLGAQAKAIILEICEHFLAAGVPVDRDPGKKRFVEHVALYVPIMTNVCQAFMRRSKYIPSEYLRGQLINIAETLKDLSPRYIRAVQGRETCPGIVDRLTGAIDEGCELTKAVPPFCARLDVECISSDFDFACSTLMGAVRDKTITDVNGSARSLAAEVNATIKCARDAGVQESLCTEAKNALAAVLTSAKSALTNPTEMARLDFAIDQLKSAMMALPAKSMVLHPDSVIIIKAHNICTIHSFFIVICLCCFTE